MANSRSRRGRRTLRQSPKVPDGTRIPSNPFFLSGLSSGEYLSRAVHLRMDASSPGPENAGSVQITSPSMVGDILEACEDAVLTGRSEKEFAELIGETTSTVLTLVQRNYVPPADILAELVEGAEALRAMHTQEVIRDITISIVNDGLHHMGSDIRCEFTDRGLRVYDRSGSLPDFAGTECLWDRMGLSRETEVPSESWNPNGISRFFHRLDFDDFRYLDAIYWRTGYLDRQGGEHRFRFVEEYDAKSSSFGVVDLAESKEQRVRRSQLRADAFSDISDGQSLWFQLARRWRMKDHIILAFEANRTRSIETVDLPSKHDLRNRCNSPDPREASRAFGELESWALTRANPIPDIEAILGRPYYELTERSFSADGSPTYATSGIDLSVASAVEDIMREAVAAMSALHVRPYIFWASETELMVAAARPGSNIGPWSRVDLESAVTLTPPADDTLPHSKETGLLQWNTVQRAALEPGYQWDDAAADNVTLRRMLADTPEFGRFLDHHSWSEDDTVLIHRLVRLSRFGYGLPSVRKPEYRDIHVLP